MSSPAEQRRHVLRTIVCSKIKSEAITLTRQRYRQVYGADGLGCKNHSVFSLLVETLVRSNVTVLHVLQNQRQVTVLHLTVLERHPVLKRRVLVVQHKLSILEEEDVFPLLVRPGPERGHHGDVGGRATWQRDHTSGESCHVSLH